MENRPLVSVIIPVYTNSTVLPRAIDSALAQDVPLEVLVINDCSPEDVDTLVAPYLDRIRYLKNPKNLGAAESRNRGVQEARGRYIAFLDADDWWRKGKLRKQLDLLQRENAVLCATARELFRPNGESTGRIISVPPVITYRDLLRENPISCSSAVMLREVALAFPMRCAADSHEDYILWLEVLQKHQKACAVNEPLLCYTASAAGKSGSKFHSAAMTWRVYRHMGFGPVRSVLSFCSYTIRGMWKHYLKK